MPRSVLAQQYQSKTKNLSKQSVRSIYNVENQINTINNNAKKRNRQRSKSPHNRRKAAKDPEDEELDMNALAEYVEELKEYMHGSGSNGSASSSTKSYINSNRSIRASAAAALKENNARLNTKFNKNDNNTKKKKMSVHEMSKVKRKVYTALNRADIAIQQQREKANIPGISSPTKNSQNRKNNNSVTNSNNSQRQQRKKNNARVSAGSLRPRLHRQHMKKKINNNKNRSSWNDALNKLTAEKIAWFETVTYVAPGKSGRLKKCSANREIVNDAFAGDPYAGFRTQILNLPKPNRNVIAKRMIKANAAKFKKRGKVNKVRGRGKKGFGAGHSRPSLPGHPGYVSSGI